eukprot:467979_1
METGNIGQMQRLNTNNKKRIPPQTRQLAGKNNGFIHASQNWNVRLQAKGNILSWDNHEADYKPDHHLMGGQIIIRENTSNDIGIDWQSNGTNSNDKHSWRFPPTTKPTLLTKKYGGNKSLYRVEVSPMNNNNDKFDEIETKHMLFDDKNSETTFNGIFPSMKTNDKYKQVDSATPQINNASDYAAGPRIKWLLTSKPFCYFYVIVLGLLIAIGMAYCNDKDGFVDINEIEISAFNVRTKTKSWQKLTFEQLNKTAYAKSVCGHSKFDSQLFDFFDATFNKLSTMESSLKLNVIWQESFIDIGDSYSRIGVVMVKPLGDGVYNLLIACKQNYFKLGYKNRFKNLLKAVPKRVSDGSTIQNIVFNKEKTDFITGIEDNYNWISDNANKIK